MGGRYPGRPGAREEAYALVSQARAAAEVVGDPVVVALLAEAGRKLDPRPWTGDARPEPAHRTSSVPEPDPPPHRLAALMLGPFRLYQDGQPVDAWHGSRGQRIVKYLLAHHLHPVPRERLIEMLWPEVDPEVGRRNLHQAVYSLRRTLHDRQPELQHVVFENECYRLNPEVGVWCDTDEFEVHVDKGRRLGRDERAAEAAAAYSAAELLYRGEFLEDTPCEEWALAEREYLCARHAEAMHHLAALNLALGRVDEAIACARRLLVRQPADEVAHQLIIRGHLAAGRRGDAVCQYRYCVDALDRAYGFPPSSDTATLCEQLMPDAPRGGPQGRPTERGARPRAGGYGWI